MSSAENSGSSAEQNIENSSSSTDQKIVVQTERQTAFGRYGRFLIGALVLAILFIISQQARYQSYFSPEGEIQEKYHSLKKHASDKVAIIRVEGAIIDPDGFVKKQIDRIREDKNVKAVVLRIDSPGGTVTASDYLLHHLKLLTKEREIPLVVSMGSICASGGYYLAMAVEDEKDSIYAENATWTGSIGVVIPHYNVSALMDKWGIEDDSIASKKLKLIGSPTRKMDEQEREILQKLVDQSYEGFKDVVRSGRPRFRKNDAALEDVATGQIFTAQQALELGLIDKIGYIEAAIERACELAGLNTEDVRAVKYTRHVPGLLESLAGRQASSPLGMEIENLLDLTAPRAYYLSTWMPSIVTNSQQ